MGFFEKLRQRQERIKSLLCVGLDSEKALLPPVTWRGEPAREWQLIFNKATIDATAEFAAAFKLNLGFYGSYGLNGLWVLGKTVEYLHKVYPEILVILDGKFGDISNSAKEYAKMAFDGLGADAVTINPLFGQEACQPFLDRKDKGIFVLCRTSNLGAVEFQEREVFVPDTRLSVPGIGISIPLWKYIAQRVAKGWNQYGNCGLVVGAMRPKVLKEVRWVAKDIPILVPGIGAQLGDLKAVIQNGLDSKGQGLLISVSRSIIYASAGKDFAEAAAKEAKRLRNRINRLKKGV